MTWLSAALAFVWWAVSVKPGWQNTRGWLNTRAAFGSVSGAVPDRRYHFLAHVDALVADPLGYAE